MTVPDLGPVWLSLQLAAVTTIVLLLIGTPLAWWLAFTRSRLRTPAEAVVALPLVLPPTVLGFYLLILLSPANPIGAFWVSITGTSLTFSFSGLVVASVLYSLPFVVQPLQGAFEAVGRAPLEAAWTLRASPLDAFINVASPLAARGYLTASVLAPEGSTLFRPPRFFLSHRDPTFLPFASKPGRPYPDTEVSRQQSTRSCNRLTARKKIGSSGFHVSNR